MPGLSKAVTFYVFEPRDIAIWLVTASALAAVAIIVFRRVKREIAWVVLLALLPLLTGMTLRYFAIQDVQSQIASGTSPEAQQAMMAREGVNMPVFWGVLGTGAVIGMAIICRLGRPKSKRQPLGASTMPPPLPGSHTDWPDIG